MPINPMEHMVRLPQILDRLRETPDVPVCCFLQMSEDESWAPLHFKFEKETARFGQCVAKGEWMWHTADEMEELYGEEYWLLIPDQEKE